MIIRTVQPGDLDRCYAIEVAAYGGDEAATREKIEIRINTWPEGFIVAERDGQVVGFINSGAAFEVTLSDTAFKELEGHDPDGPNVVIMSVAVDPACQRQGISAQLMDAFLARMKALHKRRVWLVCQTGLIEMYGRYGFQYQGVSDAAYGGLSWHEMALQL